MYEIDDNFEDGLQYVSMDETDNHYEDGSKYEPSIVMKTKGKMYGKRMVK